MDPLLAKINRRTEARALIRALSDAERVRQANALTHRIVTSPEWSAAQRILLFVPLPDEIDLKPLLALSLNAGKIVGLPAFDLPSGTYRVREVKNLTQDLVPGRFQVPEPSAQCPPIDITKLDYALVPGLAFDDRGGRLGRGKGFYDRLLAHASGLRCGAGFNEQIGPAIPIEAHDLTMHRILTAAQFYDCLRPHCPPC